MLLKIPFVEDKESPKNRKRSQNQDDVARARSIDDSVPHPSVKKKGKNRKQVPQKDMSPSNLKPPPIQQVDSTKNGRVKYINQRVAKTFNSVVNGKEEGSVYFGTIDKITSDAPLYWHVAYDDGDGEEFDESDLMKALQLYSIHASIDPKMGTSRSVDVAARDSIRTSTTKGDENDDPDSLEHQEEDLQTPDISRSVDVASRDSIRTSTTKGDEDDDPDPSEHREEDPQTPDVSRSVDVATRDSIRTSTTKGDEDDDPDSSEHREEDLQAPDISHTIVKLGRLKPFDFTFFGEDAIDADDPRQPTTAKDVLAVKQLQFQGVYTRKFSIHYPEWDKSILTSLIDLFQYFAEMGILWETFELCELSDAPLSHDFTQPILSIANGSSLFKHYCLLVPGDLDSAPDDQDREYLLPNVSRNARLESLQIYIPGQLVPGDIRALHLLLQQTKTLKELKFKTMINFDHGLLCQGLAENTTLEQLTLGFDEYDVEDEELAKMIAALQSHPKLVELTIYGSHDDEIGAHFGELCKQAFQPIANKVKLNHYEDRFAHWGE